MTDHLTNAADPFDLPPNDGDSHPRRSDTGADSLATRTGQKSAGGSGATPELRPGTILGSCELLEKIGEGGMGAVYKARHLMFDRIVAVKVLLRHLSDDPTLVARFKREMEAVARLDHEHIIRAMDAGEVQGTYFLSMEFVDGVDLQKHVAQSGPLGVGDACELLRQAAVGLAHAHQHGFVHRDLKPSNLLLSKQGKIKILDLGLARLHEFSPATNLTAAGVMMGTPDYMAPEQWDDAKSVDGRADLYSLGCTLFFLLTGRAPFDDEQHRSLSRKLAGHMLGGIPDLRPARLNAMGRHAEPDGRALDSAIAIYTKLMAKRPEQRFGSAEELAAALDAAQFASHAPERLGRTVNLPGNVLDHRFSAPAAERTHYDQPRPSAMLKSRTLLSILAALVLVGLGIAIGRGSAFVATSTAGPNLLEREPPAATSPVTLPAAEPKPAAPERPPLLSAPFTGNQAAEAQAAWAKFLGKDGPLEQNSIDMHLVLIPPGKFLLGSSDGDKPDGLSQANQLLVETPQVAVTLTEPFYVSRTEVTQEQWQRLMSSAPWGSFTQDRVTEGAEYPAVGVNWFEAIEFCNYLSMREKLPPYYELAQSPKKAETASPVVVRIGGNGYRLLTEAEWEYACRAGTTTTFHCGNSDVFLPIHEVLDQKSMGTAGGREPNGFGLQDMAGNVTEWCSDWFAQLSGGDNPLGPSPTGPSRRHKRVVRGGCHTSEVWEYRSAYRNGASGFERVRTRGFRVARFSLPEK